MIRRSAPILLGLVVCLFAVRLSGASSALRLDESRIRVSLEEAQSRVSLEVESAAAFRARVSLALLDTRDNVRAESESDVEVRRGTNSYTLPLKLPYAGLSEYERREFPWYRIRYRVGPLGGATVSPVEGVVSLSEAAPRMFELRVVASRAVRAGSTLRARVRTANPVSGSPVKGVAVSGELKLGGDAHGVVKASATTGGDGFAALDFDVPRASAGAGDVDLEVVARLGAFAQQAKSSVTLDRRVRAIITSDKALYQPGQSMHARALIFDTTDHALADSAVTLELKEDSGETVFRTETKTSRYGVATADWTIPESTKLGWYFISIDASGGGYDPESSAGRAVRVSRYDLPDFTVSTKPDRAYYLPGQPAEVEVRGDYLFGQPVKRGRVRVVRQTDRRWDSERQKYVTEEHPAVEGELDEQGHFTARVDLSEAHKELAEWEHGRFADVSYAAYITDPTTNRTEQRRFSLRVTKEPIHVYVSEGRYTQAKGLPLVFYLSTFYADGRPAECEVTVVEEGETSDTRRAGEPRREVKEPDKTLLRVRTNRYGVAKVFGPAVRKDERRGSIPLRFRARDGSGRGGGYDDTLSLGRYYDADAPELRVETDKTIYREGEPVAVELSSDAERANLFVDVSSGGRVVYSKPVRLSNGRASLVVPYDPEFKGPVDIAASGADAYGKDNDSYAFNTRTIVFPRDRELKLDVRMSRAQYKPGEEAEAQLSVRTSSGRRAESALGVVVFDKAVEERARTEEEFSNAWGFGDSLYGFWYETFGIAGVTQRDVERLDASRPAPEGLDTVAELLYNGWRGYNEANIFGGTSFMRDRATVFRALVAATLSPVREALKRRYDASAEYPSDESALARMLSAAGVDFAALRDPWGRPFRAGLYVAGDQDVLDVMSDGPDKRADTDDDFVCARLSWPYFRKHGEALNRAAARYHARTGGYIRDAAALASELRGEGFDLSSLRDPWGQAYSFAFGVDGSNYTITVRSGGANKSFEPFDSYGSDDFRLWTTVADYFEESRARVDAALARDLRETGKFPDSQAALRAALKRHGVDFDSLRDGWGDKLYSNFSIDARFADRVAVEERGAREGVSDARRTLKPVTQYVRSAALRSNGPDRVRGTPDDFTIGLFTSVTAEQSARDSSPQAASPVTTFSSGTGAIAGTVTDPNGAVVANARVTARRRYSELSFTAATDDSGRYLLRNLPVGLYDVSVEAEGFMVTVLSEVQVQSSSLTTVDAALTVGATAEAVMVSASSPSIQSTSSASVSQKNEVATAAHAQLSTPRLRDAFAETLVWQPAVETDGEGRAEVRFKLADNTTTWKMSVIASTVDGRVGVSEKEFVSTQPFFVEHDPPRVLTEGDRVSLPVVLRNYTGRAQAVEVEMRPESWFSLEGPALKRADVPASDAARATFDFRAVASIKDGRQRVTARGAEAGDAVEKTVTVHPDGEERAATDSAILGGAGALGVNVPADAVRGSIRGELKVYPNLSAHLLEGVEAIMSRPYGCGEQTISSAYPSVLVLDYYSKRKGAAEGAPLPPAVDRARRYARQGYERLLEYRAPGGGFTYWGKGEPDLALTAYALRFLTDVSRVTDVDAEDVIKETRGWLVHRQREDGSWPALDHWDGKEDPRQTALTTAFIARSLAATRGTQDRKDAQTQAVSQTQDASRKQDASPTRAVSQKQEVETLPTLPRALRYLAARAAEIDEPYLIASYALAASDAGDAEGEALAARRLAALAHEEGDGTYWALETNTPFYGWGLAGRIETTALAVNALNHYCAMRSPECGLKDDERKPHPHPSSDPHSHPSSDQRSEIRIPQLIERGLLFLLRSKDRYGVWYSTQATVNVHETLAGLIAAGDDSRAGAAAAEVFVNGRRAGSLDMPPAYQLTGPILFDLSPFLSAGDNRVELRRAAHAPRAQAQLVATFYVPWAKRATNDARANDGGAAGALRLSVAYDRASAAINEEVTCSVSAERVGHTGYGMMLAEVGLPPGVDVDRASLERAMKESGWSISSYDLLPDRLVVYLWPAGGGTRFRFKFRPRYGLDALTAPSRLYDYYNPEANVVVPPTRFVIR
jgi:A-macroglobulin TED domain/Alpha-2-macroglobulin family/Carboxypeptidase regulatory-like domain/MG2 domain/A-macroglobulin receptor binding domain/Macroglobulin domain MG3/Alpha-2-macroglobulin bait region domain